MTIIYTACRIIREQFHPQLVYKAKVHNFRYSNYSHSHITFDFSIDFGVEVLTLQVSFLPTASGVQFDQQDTTSLPYLSFLVPNRIVMLFVGIDFKFSLISWKNNYSHQRCVFDFLEVLMIFFLEVSTVSSNRYIIRFIKHDDVQTHLIWYLMSRCCYNCRSC